MIVLHPSFKKSIQFLLIFSISLWNYTGFSQTNTSFEDLAKNKAPIYHIMKRVSSNNSFLLKKYYSKKQWDNGNVSKSWTKIRSYFPKKFNLTSSTEFFMTHQFTEGGGKRLTVFHSKEIEKAAQNFNTYNYGTIVNYYKRIKKENKVNEIKEFKEKFGLLAHYFENNTKHKILKGYLEASLYNRLMKTLRDEGDHIFAAALLHEGMHATIGSASRANKINEDFKKCKTPVQWDELRGYMSETQYHFNYTKFSRDKINAHMKAINKLLDQLDKLRKYKKPIDKPLKRSERNRIEKIKAKIKAHIAMIRVSLREMKQSLDRMKSLIDFFKKQNYVKPKAPKKYKDLVTNLETKIKKFTDELQKSIDLYEKGLKDLENMLNTWNDWAKCNIDTPPKPEEHKKAKKKFDDVSWPSTPSTDDEKNVAEEKLGMTYNIGPSSESETGKKNDKEELIEDLSKKNNISSSKNDFSLSGGMEILKPKLSKLNDYYSYLNTTWDGDIAIIDNLTGFWIKTSYYTTDNLSIGLEYIHHSITNESFLQNEMSNYSSDIKLNSFILNGTLTNNLNTNLVLNISTGFGLHLANYSETEDSFNINGTSSNFGFQTSLGFSYYLTSSFDIIGSFGYRYSKLNNFNNDIEFFQPTNTEVELDFSGMFLRFGLKFNY